MKFRRTGESAQHLAIVGGGNDWPFMTVCNCEPYREAVVRHEAYKIEALIDKACNLQGPDKPTHREGCQQAESLRDRICESAGIIDS